MLTARRLLQATWILIASMLVAAPAQAQERLSAAGSTALLPLVSDAARLYHEEHKDVDVLVKGGGSITGINSVAARAVDIGDSDVTAPGHPELTDNRVAVVGFAVITNPQTGVRSLTSAQIRGIFSGDITNWKQVGGADQDVVIVNRPHSSGTRAVFTVTLMKGAVVKESGVTEDSTQMVVKIVRTTPGAISYAALSGTAGEGLNLIAIDGVAPEESNITTGRYPFWSYEHMFTYGPARGETARFIRYVRSRRDLLAKYGYIRITDMKVAEADR